MNTASTCESIAFSQPFLISITGPSCALCGLPITEESRLKSAVAKYCSNACKKKAGWRSSDAKLKERASIIQTFELPSKGLRPIDLEAVEFYKKSLGLFSISRMQGRSKQAVRKALIRAGVFKPDPKLSHDPRRRGKMAAQRALRAERKQKEKLKRGFLARAFRGLRRGVAVEETCRVLGLDCSTAWRWVNANQWYRVLRGRKKSLAASVLQYSKDKTYKWISSEFKSEGALCDEADKVLASLGVDYNREHKCKGSKCRVDFYLPKIGVFIEAKLTTKANAFDRCLGQVARYKYIDGIPSWVLVPNDVRIREDQERVAGELGAKIFRISELAAQISKA
jgi:hypothetical protein